MKADILDNRILTTEGKERAIAALTELAEKRENAHFLDLLFCEGCINGPKMLNDLSVFSRKEILAAYIGKACAAQKPGAPHEIPAEYAALDMSREFSKAPITLREPSDEEIRRALKLMKKEKPEDQLNCGACGYMTCREKAVAVCQGLAEPEMCLPYIVDELETSFQSLEQSHRELAAAQAKLVQTEKLASMGQISAGIAHEINNPLGTILLYSHLLLESLKEGNDAKADLQMIVNEASRCRKIMRGLLDFARHSRISRAPTDIGAVIREVADIMSPKKMHTETKLRFHVQQGIPETMVDADQIKQMLINLLQNGIDAIDGSGEVAVEAWFQAVDESLSISVEDNGHGIPEENLSQLFTPFFTTKEKGKGTGLGLAITYGVVKMHSGDISVDSQVGRGTKFTVSLPLKQKPMVPEPVPLAES